MKIRKTIIDYYLTFIVLFIAIGTVIVSIDFNLTYINILMFIGFASFFIVLYSLLTDPETNKLKQK